MSNPTPLETIRLKLGEMKERRKNAMATYAFKVSLGKDIPALIEALEFIVEETEYSKHDIQRISEILSRK